MDAEGSSKAKPTYQQLPGDEHSKTVNFFHVVLCAGLKQGLLLAGYRFNSSTNRKTVKPVNNVFGVFFVRAASVFKWSFFFVAKTKHTSKILFKKVIWVSSLFHGLILCTSSPFQKLMREREKKTFKKGANYCGHCSSHLIMSVWFLTSISTVCLSSPHGFVQFCISVVTPA